MSARTAGTTINTGQTGSRNAADIKKVTYFPALFYEERIQFVSKCYGCVSAMVLVEKEGKNNNWFCAAVVVLLMPHL